MKKIRLNRLIGHGRRLAATAHAVYQPEEQVADDVRITNETVAARREEVLASARKYIYPLDAPKHRVVKLSVGILIAAVLAFFSFCIIDLYKLQSTSTFIYGVTQVVPFPVAIIGNRQFVSYNDYLFELRRYMHYEETQQHADFATKDGKQLLGVLKQRSLDQAIQNAYVEQLADQNNISVSSQEVDDAITTVRTQNRLGATDQVFQSVLNEFWGWSVSDFRRELRQELLAQKVVDGLDTTTHARATAAYTKLQQGADFAAVAKEMSDDQATKASGGEYGVVFKRTDGQWAPQIIDALFKLRAGQYSPIISTGYTLEIVKVLQIQGDQLRAAHIAFNLQPITAFVQPLEKQQPVRRLIGV